MFISGVGHSFLYGSGALDSNEDDELSYFHKLRHDFLEKANRHDSIHLSGGILRAIAASTNPEQYVFAIVLGLLQETGVDKQLTKTIDTSPITQKFVLLISKKNSANKSAYNIALEYHNKRSFDRLRKKVALAIQAFKMLQYDQMFSKQKLDFLTLLEHAIGKKFPVDEALSDNHASAKISNKKESRAMHTEPTTAFPNLQRPVLPTTTNSSPATPNPYTLQARAILLASGVNEDKINTTNSVVNPPRKSIPAGFGLTIKRNKPARSNLLITSSNSAVIKSVSFPRLTN